MSCEITGRYRYKKKTTWYLGKVLALQIEIKCHDYDPLNRRYEDYIYWKDASFVDLEFNEISQWRYVEPPDTPKVSINKLSNDGRGLL